MLGLQEKHLAAADTRHEGDYKKLVFPPAVIAEQVSQFQRIAEPGYLKKLNNTALLARELHRVSKITSVRATNAVELSLAYLTQILGPQIIDGGLAIQRFNLRQFILAIDAGYAVAQMGARYATQESANTVSIKGVSEERMALYRLEETIDWIACRDLLKEDPTGMRLVDELGKTVQYKKTQFSPTSTPPAHVPEFTKLGVDLATKYYKQLYPLATRFFE